MVFTQSLGLRDREYSKFQSIQAGSLTAMNVIIASGEPTTILTVQSTGIGSIVLYGTSGTTIIPLRCTSNGFLFTSGA